MRGSFAAAAVLLLLLLLLSLRLASIFGRSIHLDAFEAAYPVADFITDADFPFGGMGAFTGVEWYALCVMQCTLFQVTGASGWEP